MKIALAFMLSLGEVVSGKDQKVTLIGAPVRANSDQKGKVLTDDSFLSQDDQTIAVTNPDGYKNELSIAQLQDFIQAVGGQVISAEVCSENMFQATASFTEEALMPYAPHNLSSELTASKLLGNGEKANVVTFIFAKPFKVAPNLSLAMTIKPSTSVCVILNIELGEVPRPVSLLPA